MSASVGYIIRENHLQSSWQRKSKLQVAYSNCLMLSWLESNCNDDSRESWKDFQLKQHSTGSKFHSWQDMCPLSFIYRRHENIIFLIYKHYNRILEHVNQYRWNCDGKKYSGISFMYSLCILLFIYIYKISFP